LPSLHRGSSWALFISAEQFCSFGVSILDLEAGIRADGCEGAGKRRYLARLCLTRG
jgi:hypothetical protein